MALFGRDYDRDFGYYGDRFRGEDRMYGGRWAGYDPDYGYGAGAGAYDRDFGYKSRWQTDYGDPFGDRVSHTPMRMVRGDFRGGYGSEYGNAYERGRYGANPMGYDPYAGRGYGGRDIGVRGSRWNRGSRWGRRPGRGWGGPAESGYDQGWF